MLQKPVKAVMGRPSKLTDDERVIVKQAFVNYIENEDYPTITGFCFRNKVAKKYSIYPHDLQDWVDFTNLRKLAIKKQELYIEEGALSGKLNAPFAQFKLKQPAMGWTDKQQIEHSGEIKRGLTDEELHAVINRSKSSSAS